MVITQKSLKIIIVSLIILTAIILTTLLAVVSTSLLNKPDSAKYENSVTGYSDGLKLTMIAEKPVIQYGEPLNVTLKLSNIGSQNITLVYPDTHVMDLHLYSNCYEPVTFTGKNMGYSAAITFVKLTPGETKQWNFSWYWLWRDETIRPGMYFLQGQILRAVITPLLPIGITLKHID